MENRPGNRPKKITGVGKSVKRRGSGLGTGPVGSAGGYSGRPGNSGQTPFQGMPENQQRGSARQTRSGGGSLKLIALLLVLLLGGGGLGIGNLLGGGSGGSGLLGGLGSLLGSSGQSSGYTQQLSQGGSTSLGDLSSLVSLLGGSNSPFSALSSSSVSTGWDRASNTGNLDRSVISGAHAKRTRILGSGKDKVTIMVYMCGTDLESQGGMATSDLQEMTQAEIGSNVNLLVYTGGCSGWKNNIISSSVNQIYQVETGGLRCLVKDDGRAAMTNPDTLTGFIQYCKKNFPANRYDLILWDHGGGSLSGYGYDEKNRSSGSMTLPQLNSALSKADTTFDFIGFDACLMATLETALTMEPYADYLIASEETEPGIGWYYTNWLTKLSSDTSMPTLDVGKVIVDDFISTCDAKCRGQKTTLSVIDLAELAYTAPDALNNFSQDAVKLLQGNQFGQVSDARSATREFASSSKIDQVDLVHLATKLGTSNSEELAKALLGAVKYNRTSSNMTNAYGLSIYFPYQKVSNVNTAVSTYEDIGMDSEYASCIQKFASMEIGGQGVSGGASSPLGSLLGGALSSSASSLSANDISQMLGSLLGGNMLGVSGLTGQNSGFLSSFLDVNRDSAYLADNMFDPSALVWEETADGIPQMRLSEKQWSLVHQLELNVFLDDGEGFIDLGLDNWYEFTEDGALLGAYDGTWLAIDQQPVAYYFTDAVTDGKEAYTITGRVPVMINGNRAELILVFDNENPDGYIAGARSIYPDGETDTVAKGMIALEEGDAIDFLCDYYSYNGDYLDSYYLGDTLYYREDLPVSYVYIDESDGSVSAAYRFTDIYHQQYWSPVLGS